MSHKTGSIFPPLFDAVTIGTPRTVQRLLDEGADAKVMFNGDSAIDFALFNDKHRLAIVKILREAGTPYDYTDRHGISPFITSLNMGDIELSKLLVPPTNKSFWKIVELLSCKKDDYKKIILKLISTLIRKYKEPWRNILYYIKKIVNCQTCISEYSSKEGLTSEPLKALCLASKIHLAHDHESVIGNICQSEGYTLWEMQIMMRTNFLVNLPCKPCKHMP
jgi:hypothetical protein